MKMGYHFASKFVPTYMYVLSDFKSNGASAHTHMLGVLMTSVPTVFQRFFQFCDIYSFPTYVHTYVHTLRF